MPYAEPMPVIVVGADTTWGAAVVPALQPASGEVRVFVSDTAVGDRYRSSAKVAIGDLSDGSHVGGAAIGAFCAVVMATAAHDDRERGFAATAAAVFAQWADGLKDAAISRIIVVGSLDEIPNPDPLCDIGAEYHYVDTSDGDHDAVALAVARLEAAGPRTAATP